VPLLGIAHWRRGSARGDRSAASHGKRHFGSGRRRRAACSACAVPARSWRRSGGSARAARAGRGSRRSTPSHPAVSRGAACHKPVTGLKRAKRNLRGRRSLWCTATEERDEEGADEEACTSALAAGTRRARAGRLRRRRRRGHHGGCEIPPGHHDGGETLPLAGAGAQAGRQRLGIAIRCQVLQPVYMSGRVCVQLDCARHLGDRPIKNCTPVSAAFQKSFADATVEDIKLKGIVLVGSSGPSSIRPVYEAAVKFSNGVVVVFDGGRPGGEPPPCPASRRGRREARRRALAEPRSCTWEIAPPHRNRSFIRAAAPRE
jgi:hypothetical protein